jgi:HEPN domain-containing protein
MPAKTIYTKSDFQVSDLIQYSLDHFEAAKLLHEHSSKTEWKYLHSAALLLHLSIELILKACLLHLEGQFQAGHNLKELYKRLCMHEFELSDKNKNWLEYLSQFNEFRYPNYSLEQEVNLMQLKKTETLFKELHMKLRKDLKIEIAKGQRYKLNVKSGKII